MNKKIWLIVGIVVVAAALAIAGIILYKAGQKNEKSQLIGGDRDVHGCIGSAGYTWCAQKSKCLRTWEESCQ